MATITIELPDDVAKSAQQAGILSGQTLASIVRELVRDRAARMLQQAMWRLDEQAVSAHELTLAISSVWSKSGRVDVVTRPSCHQSRRVLPSTR